MWNRISRRSALVLALAASAPLATPSDEADARGFRASFRSAARAVPSPSPAVRSIARSADVVATEQRRESHVNWSAVAEKGLDVAKNAFDAADRAGSFSGSSGSSGGSTGTSSGGAFSSPSLARIELEACIREANTLDTLSDSFDSAKAQAETARAEVRRAEAEVEQARGSVDRYSQRSVNAFNARLDAYRQRVAHFNNTVLGGLEQRRLTLNARVATFNKYCQGKSYYQDDLLAVETRTGIKLAQ